MNLKTLEIGWSSKKPTAMQKIMASWVYHACTSLLPLKGTFQRSELAGRTMAGPDFLAMK